MFTNILPFDGRAGLNFPLVHGSQLGHSAWVEFSPEADPVRSHIRLLPAEAPDHTIMTEITLDDAMAYARLIIRISDLQAQPSTHTMMWVRWRAEPTKGSASQVMVLGLTERNGQAGWQWIQNSRQEVILPFDWTETLFILPDREARADPVHLMLHLGAGAELGIEHLSVLRLSLPARFARGSLVVDPGLPPPAGAVWGALALLRSPRVLAYLVCLPADPSADGTSVFLEAGAAAWPVAVQWEKVGEGVFLASLSPPLRAGRLMLSGADGLRICLGSTAGADLRLDLAEVSYEDQLLRVKANLSGTDLPRAEGEKITLFADDLPLQTLVIPSISEGVGEFLSLNFELPSSERTAERGLRLYLPRFEITLALPHPSPWRAPRPQAPLGFLAETVEGSFDGLRTSPTGAALLVGWARSPNHPGEGVRLDVFFDQRLIASGNATGWRHDIATKLGGSPVAGFAIELPANLDKGRNIKVSVQPHARHGVLLNATQSLRFPPFGTRLPGKQRELDMVLATPLHLTRAPSCAAIILSQDGAEVLEVFLESLLRFEPEGFKRIIIIDHESSDGTAVLVARYAALLPITLISRPRTASFAESNNYGARLCDEETLFFINNDVTLISPIVAAMDRHVGEGRGLVGCRLLDSYPPGSGPESARYERAQQHVGIHFDPASPGAIRPFESRLLSDAPAANTRAIIVPAVTGALFAIRRQLFEALGGFDTMFFYGWEDIDLCLRAAERGGVNIAANDVAAVHLRAYSRSRLAPDAAARRALNPSRFNTRWAYTIRAAMRRQLLNGRGHWTGRRLHFGFVISDTDEMTRSKDARAARGLAQSLCDAIPAQCFLFSSHAPVDASDIDVMIVMVDDFDPRGIIGLGFTSLLIAWAGEGFHQWSARPWRERFALWFATSERAVAYLCKETGREVHLLREAAAVTAEPPSAVVLGDAPDFPPALLARLRGARQDPQAGPPLVVHHADPHSAAWGLLGHDVLDALAGGALVITDNVAGLAEALPGLLPIHDGGLSLATHVERFLGDTSLSRVMQKAARAAVLAEHSWEVRARQFLQVTRQRLACGLSIGIKVSPQDAAIQALAVGLQRELEALGHMVRIDSVPEEQMPDSRADDVCLILRGAVRHVPQPHQINLLWVLDGGEAVSVSEINAHDLCMAGSQEFAGCHAPLARTHIAVLEFVPGEHAAQARVLDAAIRSTASSRDRLRASWTPPPVHQEPVLPAG